MAILPSGLPEDVHDDEDLARFLTSSSQFSSNGPKETAFRPAPRNGETSVFRHGPNPIDGLWQIADEYVRGQRQVHGAAIIKARHVRNSGAQVVAMEPPPRHANIVGWPYSGTDPELDKAKRKLMALEMAQYAELLIR